MGSSAVPKDRPTQCGSATAQAQDVVIAATRTELLLRAREAAAEPRRRRARSYRVASREPSLCVVDNGSVPRGAYSEKEKLAVEIVREREIARGWAPGPLLGQHAQHEQGCDLLSSPPDGGLPSAIEVKAWGEPLLRPNGTFTYPADVNAEQLERARIDPDWRLIIVANLDAVRAGVGEAQLLDLDSAEVTKRAIGWRYRVPLGGLEDCIKS